MKFSMDYDGDPDSEITTWIEKHGRLNVDTAIKKLIRKEIRNTKDNEKSNLSDVLAGMRRIEAEISELKEILGKKENEGEVPNDVIDNINKIGIRR